MSALARAALLALALLAALVTAGSAVAQKGKQQDEVCPYCKNDPALMQRAGIVSHGPFDFGASDSAHAEVLAAGTDVKWIEGEHFRIGFGIVGNYKVKDTEKKKVRAELTRLAEALPAVDPKAVLLDPWLRTHLFAQRCEDIWKRVVELFQVDPASFPDGTKLWDMRVKYMGEGPYLGQKGKYEMLIVPNENALVSYLKNEFGLTTRKNQRWNVIKRDTLTVVINTQEGNLRDDLALHGHVGFNLSINLLDGYKHYSYDTPIWLREGLGHFIEREISPKHNTFDSSEGSVAEMTRKERWEPEVRKLIASGEAPRMAELVSMKDYADLTLERHYACWSMIDYIVKTNPKGFACLQDALHGRTNASGIADGANLLDVHREKFKECLGFANYQAFDAAWATWVQENYAGQ